MDSVYVKRTLRAPILRKLGRCVAGAKERGQLLVRRTRARRSRGGGGGGERRGASRRDRPARRRPSNRRKEPVVTSCSFSYRASYSRQADLQGKERTSGGEEGDATTRRNAERATMRGHFRSKYRLGKNRKDAKHVRSAGGKSKVSLPAELSKLVRPKSQPKDDQASFSLLSAFQNLGFNGAAGPAKKTPTAPSPTTTHVPVGPCKVM